MDCLLSARAQGGETVEQDVGVTERVSEVERLGERGGVEIDLRVGFDQGPEVLAFLP
jgi:hypothetical protein